MWCLPHCCVFFMSCLHASYGHAVALETRFNCSVVTLPSSATCRLVSRGHCPPLVGGPQATLNTAATEWGLGPIRVPTESSSSKELAVRFRHICIAEKQDIWCKSSCLECQEDKEVIRTMTNNIPCVCHGSWAPWWCCVLKGLASAHTGHTGPRWMRCCSPEIEPQTTVLCILQQAVAPAVLSSGLELSPPPDETSPN
jgi:hypothetical protein